MCIDNIKTSKRDLQCSQIEFERQSAVLICDLISLSDKKKQKQKQTAATQQAAFSVIMNGDINQLGRLFYDGVARMLLLC